MAYVYFLYGLAFIATGLILGLQARLPFALLPRRALGWLSAFAFVHGAAEWTLMWLLVEQPGVPLPPQQRSAVLIPIALSFGLLLEFGVDLWVTTAGRRRWLRLTPVPLVILAVGAAAWTAPANDADTTATVEALIRYGLALGAALLSAHGLLQVRRSSLKALTPRSRRLLVGGSVALVAYALVAGVIVAPAPFFPASHLNAASVRALTGVPIEVFRALCAGALALILSEIFVVETSRSRAELARLREEFISLVAHDLRSPITTINLTAGLMETKLPDGEAGAALRPQLEKILACSHRIDRMISDLLDASRIEARQLSLLPKPTDMRALIRAAADRSAAVCAGHPLRIELPDQLPALGVDPDRVEQVLTNLLSNAGKYAREGSEIVVGVTTQPPHLEVAVSNLGVEIGPAEAEQIFTRFYRAQGAARRAPGLGVGLYIARGLVEAHGGRIWVESQDGRTTFRFTLPLTSSAVPLP